jgi:hypothetical protein
MGADPEEFVPRPYGQKEIELVRKIAEKTKLGKIAWNRTRNGMRAPVRGMEVVFVRAAPFPPNRGWALFLVKGKDGNEILKISASDYIFGALMGKSNALMGEIDKLYAVVEDTAKGDIEKAINEIDQV